MTDVTQPIRDALAAFEAALKAGHEVQGARLTQGQRLVVS